METSTILTIVTSSIALVVAIISGLFSYFSSKRAAKVEAMKGYVNFLDKKMQKLEKALDETVVMKLDMQSQDYTSALVNSYIDTFYKNYNILFKYVYLFNQTAEFKRLYELGKKHDEYVSDIKKKHEKDPFFKNSEITELTEKLSKYNIDVRQLITDELKDTTKLFKNLSLLKK